MIKMKVIKYIDKKSVLNAVIDVMFLIALFPITVAVGLLLFRGWSIIVAFLGTSLGVILIVACAVFVLCLLYTAARNLVLTMSLINRTVISDSEEADKT